ncbi:MBL fold metallo-hydrolase [Longimicrobium sp.]|uniref:MBL fold metallo-hydrolase n=1 Tax=Longimicrobium sp. TaxID=2029185 RepID=UPI002C735DD1|nr:MBL fold metallo-hydrolase [Longimicrobium sp.]HSU17806.1 MBL fold metallo-hydrolase [Longimicrobium sp.]
MTAAIRSLLAPNPGAMTLDGTRTYIVGRDRPAVIDPGPDDPAHLRAILDALGGASPTAILLTHSHSDHTAAAPALAAATGAPVMIARGSHLNPEGDLISRWLEEGDEIETDAGALHVVPTPGHAPEHVAFHHSGSGALFVGDTFMGGLDTTLVSPPEGDLAAYLRSLERIASLAPSILHPAHGPDIADPAEAVARYRRHREERIAQVVRALRAAGPSRTGDLIDAVYGAELDPRLRLAAEGSLTAILGYLAAEGRARALPGGLFHLLD